MHLPNAVEGLTPADRSAFFELGQGAIILAPFHCVHHAFEAFATSYPQNVAVEDFEERITYADLENQANALAIRLRAIRIGRGSRVCLLVERSIHMVIGILAILKAGAAYVPLDGNVASDKTIEHVLRDSQAAGVLVLHKFKERVIANVPVICLEDILLEDDLRLDWKKPEDYASADDSVYIIYTSGTTGVPKGVDVKHGNVTNLVCLTPGNLGLVPGKRISQLMNIAFDMAAWEILGSLCNGATLCLRGKSSKQWKAVMKTVQVVIATPSMLLPHPPSEYPNVETVAVAGEPCPLWPIHGGRVPNSTTVVVLPRHVTPLITIVNTMQLHVPGTVLSIGKPTPNNTVYVLNEDMQPVLIGQQGIMWAGGAGITRGYLNLPEKTSERYKLDPFVNDGSMMFNTGDLGRWLSTGGLEHLGRIDDQVKVKGFRVELDGVAAAMETCPGIQAAVALLIDGVLWGFATPASVDQIAVTTAAAKIQPYYAVPTRILTMDEFPKTPNGKNDKRALRQLALDHLQGEKSIVPSTPVIPLQVTEAISSLLDGSNWAERTIQIALPANPKPVYLHITARLSDTMEVPNLTNIQPPPFSESSLPDSVGTKALDEKDRKVQLESQMSPSTFEKGLAWEGYLDDEIPDKTQGHYVRNLRHQIFTLYRRLFGVIFVVNMAIFIAVCVRGASLPKIGEIVVANLFCAILMRQDYIINAFFNVSCAVPTSWPLAIRRVCARVYHIGGLHSGCAISGVLWLVLFTGKATKELVDGGRISVATLAVTYWIMIFLLGIVVFAHPDLRTKKHDSFERVHRFLGWSAAAMVWAQVILLINDYKEPGQPLSHAMKTTPAFWLLVVLTGSLILPWLRLRKVNVRSEVLSNHAVRFYFDYGVTPVAGSFVRISESPLMEWHGFATIPEPGKTGYSLVVSRAGDWTSKQIENPPTKLWIRGIPTCGVLRIVPLFRRLVFVATGSGIGPCAPCILEQRVPIRLLWTSPNVRKTFGDKLVDDLLEKSPDAVIYDTRTHGKPDMVKLTYRLVREFNAEAVCVISNQKLTRKVVYGMMSRGIPAFGAIWDS
uniref:Putative nonribosomal peptide synthetase 12 n=1 Tax=Moniliophthora roreri TaxID=221103 RepID=A0A0W0F3F9_MONRR